MHCIFVFYVGLVFHHCHLRVLLGSDIYLTTERSPDLFSRFSDSHRVLLEH